MQMDLHFLYRDANLPDAFIAKYTPGIMVKELGLVDTSKLRGGPNGNIRYLFISNRGRDLTVVDGIGENAKRWGLILFERGTIFLVLDNYTFKGHSQVLLTTEHENHFQNDQIISAARQDFEELASQPPAPELAGADWTERVKDPVGLDDNGHPFPLNN